MTKLYPLKDRLRNRFFAIRRAAAIAWRLFNVRAFGTYVNSVGGPGDFDDGSIWEYKGAQYKLCEARVVVIKVRLTDLPQGMRDAITELRLA